MGRGAESPDVDAGRALVMDLSDVLLLLGMLTIVVGAALIYWPAAVIVFGVLLGFCGFLAGKGKS